MSSCRSSVLTVLILVEEQFLEAGMCLLSHFAVVSGQELQRCALFARYTRKRERRGEGREKGCPWSYSTCYKAAVMGHLGVLKWARD